MGKKGAYASGEYYCSPPDTIMRPKNLIFIHLQNLTRVSSQRWSQKNLELGFQDTLLVGFLVVLMLKKISLVGAYYF